MILVASKNKLKVITKELISIYFLQLHFFGAFPVLKNS